MSKKFTDPNLNLVEEPSEGSPSSTTSKINADAAENQETTSTAAEESKEKEVPSTAEAGESPREVDEKKKEEVEEGVDDKSKSLIEKSTTTTTAGGESNGGDDEKEQEEDSTKPAESGGPSSSASPIMLRSAKNQRRTKQKPRGVKNDHQEPKTLPGHKAYEDLRIDTLSSHVSPGFIPKFQQGLSDNVGVLLEVKTAQSLEDMTDEQQKRFKDLLFATTMLRKLITDENPSCGKEVCEALGFRALVEEEEVDGLRREDLFHALIIWIGHQDKVVRANSKEENDNKNPVTTLIHEILWLLVNLTSLTGGGLAGDPCSRLSDPSSAWTEVLRKVLQWTPAWAQDAVNNAVWALSNCAGESTKHRNGLLDSGILSLLVDLVCKATGGPLDLEERPALCENVAWCLSNLVRGKPGVSLTDASLATPAFARLMTMKPQKVISSAAWGLSYLADGGLSEIETILNSGVLPRLVTGLAHPNDEVLTPCLRTVGSIATGSDQQTQAVLNAGVLPCCGNLLTHPKVAIRKEVCWMLSNVTAGTAEQIQAVINAGLIPGVLNSCRAVDLTVKKEAAWCICNITAGGTSDQLQYLVHQGSLETLCELLDLSDPRVIQVALEGVDGLLRAGEELKAKDGLHINPYAELMMKSGSSLDMLENLQTHTNDQVYQQANDILEQYFDAEDDLEDKDSDPDDNADGQGYEL